MRILTSWLKDLIEFDLPARELAEVLTEHGTEAEQITRLGDRLDGVAFAEVKESSFQRTVVEADGQTYEIDAEMPLIEGSKVSIDPTAGELVTWETAGLAASHYPVTLPREMSQEQVLTDHLIEFEVLSNRGDLLSHLGIAREVSLAVGGEVNVPETADLEPGENDGEGKPEIRLPEPELGPRYAGLGFPEVKLELSPPWLAYRIGAMGSTPKNSIVDLTNYILFELGQPLHAFDWDRLGDYIAVTTAGKARDFAALDDKEYEIQPDHLTIESRNIPVALAGVIGSTNSAVTGRTERVFLEAAWFEPDKIRATSYELGLRTESSHRFGRGVDPDGTLRGALRFAHLAEELGVGEPDPSTFVDVDEIDHGRESCELVSERLSSLIGIELSGEGIAGALRSSGCRASADGGEVEARPPSWRFDLEIAEDFAEEVLRIRGYQELPSELPELELKAGRLNTQTQVRRRVRDLFNRAGFQETISYSMTDPELLEELYGDEEVAPVAIENPDSEELSVMQPTMVAGLLGSLKENLRRDNERIPPLFEIGRTFHPGSPSSTYSYTVPGPEGSVYSHETERLGLLATADMERFPSARSATGRLHPLFRLKGALEAAAEELGIGGDLNTQAADSPSQAWLDEELVVFLGEEPIGYLGEVSDDALSLYDLGNQRAAIGELNLEAIIRTARRHIPIENVSEQPEVERDLALIVDRDTAGGDLLRLIRTEGGELLKDAYIFDQTLGGDIGLGEDRKSVAFHLVLQAFDRTLEGDEVDDILYRVLTALYDEQGAVLREYEQLPEDAVFHDPERWSDLVNRYQN